MVEQVELTKERADSLIDKYFTKADLYDQAVAQATLSSLIGEDVADHRVDADVFSDGRGHHAEVIDELSKLFSFLHVLG